MRACSRGILALARMALLIEVSSLRICRIPRDIHTVVGRAFQFFCIIQNGFALSIIDYLSSEDVGVTGDKIDIRKIYFGPHYIIT